MRTLLVYSALLQALLLPGLALAASDNPEQTILADPKALASEARATITEIKAAELHRLLDSDQGPLLVDVRTEKEYLAGHLRGATWIPRGKLEFAIGKLEDGADTDILLYCRTGSRAALAAKALQDMGYTNVQSLEGGFREWVEADYSIYNQHGEIRVVEFEAAEDE